MDLQRIKVTHFKSIYDTLELDFEQCRGLWKISGNVGSGKTTVGEAIIFGLFGDVNGKNLSDLVSWGEKKGEIELWLNSKGHDIYIHRTFGKSSTLAAEIDGEELMFTNKKDAQKQLETEYYDVSKLTVQLLCIISFNNFKSIASLNTKDTKDFLDQVFGFYILTKYGDTCKQFRKENLVLLQQANTQIVSLNGQIEKIEKLAQIERISGETAKAKEEADKINKQITDVQTKGNEVLRPFDAKIRELTSANGQITAQGNDIKRKIEFISKGICPTCGAPIDQSPLEGLKAEKEELGNKWKENNSAIQEQENKKKEMQTRIQNKLNELRTKYNEAYSLYTKLLEQDKRDAIGNKEIGLLTESLEKNKKEYKNYEKDDKEWNELYNVITGDVKAALLLNFVDLLNVSIQNYTAKLHQPWKISFDENFKCNIELFGMKDPIPTSSLSTGQLKTVDMSIILGILNVIMSNINFNILFLDELISNMDAELRYDVCSVLRENLQSGQTMFLISHTELDDKWFDGNINITQSPVGNFQKSVFKIS